MSVLVISLDFELFWGVTDSKSIKNYGANIEGEWIAVPAMLELFKRFDVHATWATVGMLMCEDFKQWCDLRPRNIQTYAVGDRSAYSVGDLARDYPSLFFARPLVEKILATDGQELASHTYSHFCCGQPGVSPDQFVEDLACFRAIAEKYRVTPTSLVFPRNQIREEYLSVAAAAGFTAYRGNEDHWLYRDGHLVPGGALGRALRAADAYLSLSGNHVARWPTKLPARKLVNISASRFLRPTFDNIVVDTLHLHRIKKGMLEAAKTDGVFHLWWHPHNFGQNTEINLMNLERILKYYRVLNQEYGMRSLSMREVAGECK